ncbi:MAG: hypothetical protein MUE99_05605, partial [Chitinophagaceae bacterium]|nr:hypothetical protein [Chitinophagaceae bacterium]
MRIRTSFLQFLIPVIVSAQANVGIGTTMPKAALAIHSNSVTGNIEGAQLLLFEEENDFARLRMTNSLHSTENNKFWDIAARISNGTAGPNDRLNIFLNGYGDVISLNGLGNIGIGTGAPVAARVHLSYPDAVPLVLQGGPGLFLPFFENNDYRGYIGSYAGNANDVDFGTGAGNTT